MTKILYIISFFTAAVLLTACSHDENSDLMPLEPRSINFGTVLEAEGNGMTADTRAGTTIPLYNYVKDFVVYGINGNLAGDGTFSKKDMVCDNYVVWHIDNSAGSTTTNSDNWEYVGNYTTAGGKTTGTQRVKYWDYSQNTHFFWALANADRGEFTESNLGTDGRVATFTLNLSPENLTESMALYYSEIKHVDMLDYGKVVTFVFKPYLSRVRFAFYETMEGFVVNNLKMDDSDSDDAKDLRVESDFVGNGAFINNGTCILTYNYNTETITTGIDPSNTSTTMNIGRVQYQRLSPKTDMREEEDFLYDNEGNLLANDWNTGTYLGRSSNNPSFAEGGGAAKGYYINVLPYENREKPLTLKCSYDITNTKTGTTQTIGQSQVSVPKDYTKWLPGYEYTYIFKISERGLQFVDMLQIGVKEWVTETTDNHNIYNW